MRGWVGSLAVLALLATAGCGSSKTKTVTVKTQATAATTATAGSQTRPPGSATAADTTPTTSPTAVHLTTFKSPSGNIGCIIASGTARCDIKQRSWSPGSRPAGCPSQVDYGQGVEVSGSGAGRLVCAGDTALDPRAATLGYGSDTFVEGFRCSSRAAGITCAKADMGHGFFVSASSYRTF